MQMCYIDESGDTGAFNATERNSQPVFLLCALMLDQCELEGLTKDIIALKQRFFPSYANSVCHWHDWLRTEIKGANVRRALREDTHKSSRHIIGFLDSVVGLMETHSVRIAARVYIKETDKAFNGTNVYSAAIQRLAQTFEDWLMRRNDKGVIILDSRNKVKNVPVAHSLFTWNFSGHGSGYRYVAELPLFGHSDNHALLQLADWVGSALLSPMATMAFCAQYADTCVHASSALRPIREIFGQRIKALQYRYEVEGKKRGGIHVLGGSHKFNPLLIFGDKAMPASAGPIQVPSAND